MFGRSACLAASLLCFMFLPLGCTTGGQVTEGASAKGIINLESARITGSSVRITQIIGNVRGMPAGTYAQVMAEIDGEETAQAKRDLKITDFVDQIQVGPSALGWRWAGTYRITLSNTSLSKTYTVSGRALLAGRTRDESGKDLLITSEDGHVASQGAVTLTPGGRGELVFDINRTAAGLFQKAASAGARLTETQVFLLTPNDGVVWRPNWPDAADGGILVGLSVTAR